jgi:hypothetical protein
MKISKLDDEGKCIPFTQMRHAISMLHAYAIQSGAFGADVVGDDLMRFAEHDQTHYTLLFAATLCRTR